METYLHNAMPSDIHQLPGKKIYVSEEDISLLRLVRQKYPNTTAEGAYGTYMFCVNGKLVGEAWIHPTKPGWWLRLL